MFLNTRVIYKIFYLKNKEHTLSKEKGKKKEMKESTTKFNLDHTPKIDSLINYPKDDISDLYLVKLAYETKGLEPYLSQRTVYHHYTDHHLDYYNKVKAFVNDNRKYKKVPPVKLLRIKDDPALLESVRTNIVLLCNHNFYWQSMTPKGGIASEKKSKLTKAVVDAFGSVNTFKKKFTAKAMKIGIGWIWLFKTDKGIEIVRTDYTTSLLPSSYKPLLAMDVWEHAYYIDYGNFRQKYIENYLNYLVNWDFAEANYNK
jgi:Fe-Mn family superoxide dismutase